MINYLYLNDHLAEYKDFLLELEKMCQVRFKTQIQLYDKKVHVVEASDQESLDHTFAFLRKILIELDHLRFPKWWLNIIETIERGFLMTELTEGNIYDHVI